KLVEVALLGKIADAFLGAYVGGELAEEGAAPEALVQQAEHDLDGGGLAGAVRAQKAEDLATVDVEGHVIHGLDAGPHPEILEDLGEMLDGDDALRAGKGSAGGVGGNGGGSSHAGEVSEERMERRVRWWTGGL